MPSALDIPGLTGKRELVPHQIIPRTATIKHNLLSKKPFLGHQKESEIYKTPMHNDLSSVHGNTRMMNCDNTLIVQVGRPAKAKFTVQRPCLGIGYKIKESDFPRPKNDYKLLYQSSNHDPMRKSKLH